MEPIAATLFATAVSLAMGQLAERAMGKKGGRRWGKRSSDPLDDVMFHWPAAKDPFTLRQMLRSVEIKGITGSGKSSGSGKLFTEAIVRHPRSTCLIVAQKAEDKQFYQAIFERYKKRLVVMEEGSKWRCNFLDTELRAGSDTRGMVEFLWTLGEALDGGHARTTTRFGRNWRSGFSSAQWRR